jgi:16S rRNA (uracil1498-N3)-methyltransferase
MSLPTFHVPDLAATAGGAVEVTGDEAHHAVVVRRIRAGEQIALTDGAGTTAL